MELVELKGKSDCVAVGEVKGAEWKTRASRRSAGEEKRGSVMIFFHRVPEATSILSPILAAIGLGSRVIKGS